MIAASFIGAEYSSGSIANWLTFVPRRGRVFWSKLLTMIGFAAVLGAFAAALVLFAAECWHGSTAPPPSRLPSLARWEGAVCWQ